MAIVLVLAVVAFRAFRREGYTLNDDQRNMLKFMFTQPDTKLTDAEQSTMMQVIDGIDSNNPDGPLYLKPALMSIYSRYPNLPRKIRGVLELVPNSRNMPSDSVGTSTGMPSKSVGINRNRKLNNLSTFLNF